MGLPAEWSYLWTLAGQTVGTGRWLNYTFDESGRPDPTGNYSFSLRATDLEGGVAAASTTVSVRADPVGGLTIADHLVFEGAPDSVSAYGQGGVSPYSFDGYVTGPGVHAPLTFSQGSASLPTKEPGTLVVWVNLTDATGYRTALAPQDYQVSPTIAGTARLSGDLSDGATLTGETVTLEVCVTGGGTAPFFAGFNFNGTTPQTWGAITKGTCLNQTQVYSGPGFYWISSQIRDSQGRLSSISLLSLQVLAAPVAPVLPTSPLRIPVETSRILSVPGEPSDVEIDWRAPPGTNLSAVELTNGSLEVTPSVLGTYTVGVSVTVFRNGTTLGPTLWNNLTLQVVAGSAATVTASVSARNLTLAAGGNLSLVWRAFDAWGNLAAPFTENVTVTVVGGTPASLRLLLRTPSGPVGVDAAGTGFSLPASAWQGGTLNLTFTEEVAANITLEFAGRLVPTSWPLGIRGPNLPIEWTPDFLHLDLFDPEVALSNSTANHTRWQISDAYGNPLRAGYVVIVGNWGAYSTTARSPILLLGRESFVWVNYTTFGSEGGSVEVLSEYGQTLLPTIGIPPPTPSTPPARAAELWGVGVLGLALVLGVTSLSAGLLLWMRRRQARSHREEATEEELADYAREQERFVDHVAASEPVTMEELERVGARAGLDPPVVMAHLLRLRADGRLVTEPSEQDEGAPVFRLSPSERARRGSPVPGSSLPRIEFDPEALVDPPTESPPERD
jgi:hypothetical protein